MQIPGLSTETRRSYTLADFQKQPGDHEAMLPGKTSDV